MLEQILRTPVTNFPIDPILFIISLGESFLMGYIVLRVYRFKKRFSTQGQGFQTSMLMMAPLIALILMFIGSNLALSIGMVGALSIVRFRTVLKDPLDLMYLFLLIGIGLGCGTYNFSMTAIGVGLILALVTICQTRNPTINGGVLLVRSSDENSAAKFAEELLKRIPSSAMDRMDLNSGSAEYNFSISESTPKSLAIIEELRNTHKIESISYYNNQSEF